VGKLPRGNRLVGLLLFDHVYDELSLRFRFGASGVLTPILRTVVLQGVAQINASNVFDRATDIGLEKIMDLLTEDGIIKDKAAHITVLLVFNH